MPSKGDFEIKLNLTLKETKNKAQISIAQM